MPCIFDVAIGIGIVGFIFLVSMSVVLSMFTRTTDIYTILSELILTPVVSKSKKASGFVKFKFILFFVFKC